MKHEEIVQLLRDTTSQLNAETELLVESHKNTEHFQNKCNKLEAEVAELMDIIGLLMGVFYHLGFSNEEITDHMKQVGVKRINS